MRSLFISYDGMTDTLGQSQVIPYLAGLAARGHAIEILSCEKPDHYGRERATIEQLLKRHGIAWRPVLYHKKPPVLAKLWDLHVLEGEAVRAFKTLPYDAVHCRSYLPALVGSRLKRRLGVSFIFDMRGFWADERLDGGLWSASSPVYGPIYRYFKRRERQWLREADRVVCLTHAASRQIADWGLPEVSARTSVIPCCADLEHFSRARVQPETVSRLRAELGLAGPGPVLVYLGSLGTWYGLGEMIDFFAAVLRRKPGAKFLFITGEPAARVHAEADARGIARDRVPVVFARRNDVPAYLATADVGVFFMKVTRSRAGFSPTKLAELLGMGLPVIVNAGIGDTEAIVGPAGVAEFLSSFSPGEYDRGAAAIERLQALSHDAIRDVALRSFSLDDGVRRYAEIYDKLTGPETELRGAR